MGSVINLRTFILQEMATVNLICSEPTKTLEISYKDIEIISLGYPEFSKNFRLFQNNYFKSNKRYPLDYIVGIPTNQKLPASILEHDDPKGMLRRELIFKNTVMNIIRTIRRERAKPKLNEIMQIMKHYRRGKKTEMSIEEKKVILDKIKLIYGSSLKDIMKAKFEDAPKNTKLFSLYDRTRKSLHI